MDLNELKNNPDQIKQLIGLLSSLLNSEPEQDDSKPTKIKTKNKKVRSTKKNKNLFDSMSIKDSHKDDTRIDEILNKNKSPTERNRDFNFVDVRCRQCGKEDNVNPSLVYDIKRYKCNDCSKTGG